MKKGVAVINDIIGFYFGDCKSIERLADYKGFAILKCREYSDNKVWYYAFGKLSADSEFLYYRRCGLSVDSLHERLTAMLNEEV